MLVGAYIVLKNCYKRSIMGHFVYESNFSDRTPEHLFVDVAKRKHLVEIAKLMLSVTAFTGMVGCLLHKQISRIRVETLSALFEPQMHE